MPPNQNFLEIKVTFRKFNLAQIFVGNTPIYEGNIQIFS